MDYDRWRVPPAAIAVQIGIGQVAAFSAFSEPLTRAIGVTVSAPRDWTLAAVGWIGPVAIVFLGLSAAAFGRWIEDAGPRQAMFASAACVGCGWILAAVGVHLHQLWIVYLGYSVIGGIGLGLGYAAPISTLVRWFPDRAGTACGLPIAGFGGGAVIASPLAVALVERFQGPTSTGVASALVAMGVVSFAFMMFGVFTVRVPAPGWKPATFTSAPVTGAGGSPVAPPVGRPAGRSSPERRGAAPDVHMDQALRTPQFWLIWTTLGLAITAGVGVLAAAAPMIQQVFPNSVGPVAAAGYVGLLGVADGAGRLIWSSVSDMIGRRRTYLAVFALGALLCALLPATGGMPSVLPLVAVSAGIVSVYGGALATLPAYVRDTFGVMHLGAIHGRLLTAWSLAAVAGPALVNSIVERQVANGVPTARGYSVAMYAMAALMTVGLIATWRVRAADSRRPVRRSGEGQDA